MTSMLSGLFKPTRFWKWVLLLLILFIGVAFMLHSFAARDSGSSAKIILCPNDADDTSSNSQESARFVYCGPAVCKRNRDGKTASCRGCYTMTGMNLGTTMCADRAPHTVGKGAVSYTVWTSSFSARKLAVPGIVKQPTLICNPGPDSTADDEYADCLDAKCLITNVKKGLADCTCVIRDTQGLGPRDSSWTTQVRSCQSDKVESGCNVPDEDTLGILNGAPTKLVIPMMVLIAKNTKTNMDRLICNEDEFKP